MVTQPRQRWRHGMETHNWPFVRGIHPGHPGVFPSERGQSYGPMIVLCLVSACCWTNSRYAGDLRRHDTHVTSPQWDCITTAIWQCRKPFQPMAAQLSNESCTAVGWKACDGVMSPYEWIMPIATEKYPFINLSVRWCELLAALLGNYNPDTLS